jgi:histidinol-phosphatase (PHP family)
MLLADDHLHTTFSMDGLSSMRDMVQAAAARGLFEICVTDHIDTGHPECDHPIDFDAYFQEIEACRALYPQLTIHAGLEIGDNAARREYIHALIDPLPLDFHLLSLHLVDGADPYFPHLFEGYTRDAFYRRYAQCRLESVLHFGAFDALAHLGYCGKFAPYPREQKPLRWRDAPDQLDAVLRFLAQNGKALEINTSGFKTTDEPIPSTDILRRYHELGGEFITLGADAHQTEWIGYAFDKARSLALSCGIRWAVTFEKHTPRPYALEE